MDRNGPACTKPETLRGDCTTLRRHMERGHSLHKVRFLLLLRLLVLIIILTAAISAVEQVERLHFNAARRYNRRAAAVERLRLQQPAVDDHFQLHTTSKQAPYTDKVFKAGLVATDQVSDAR